MKKKINRLQYLLYHKTWKERPEGSLHLLHSEGVKVTIEEYKHELEKHFFCPRCGYPCARIPNENLYNVANIKAFFRHYKGSNPRSCPFWTPKREGENYSKTATAPKTVEDDFLVEINTWKLEAEQADHEYESIPSNYGGIHEDKNGTDTNDTISRHIGNNIIHRSQIKTVQYIANVLPKISYKHIILPGHKLAFLFSEVFLHASEITDKRVNFNALYWGKVEETCVVGDYFCIVFGYENYCIYYAYPLRHTTERKWDKSFLKGKNIIVAGIPQPTKKIQALENNQGGNRICLKVEAKAWGAAGVIPRDNERFLENFSDVMWVAPPLLRVPTAKSTSASIAPQSYLNDIEVENRRSISNHSEEENDSSIDLTQKDIDISEDLGDAESLAKKSIETRQKGHLNSPERKQSFNNKKHVSVINEWPSSMKGYQALADELDLITERSRIIKRSDMDSSLINAEKSNLHIDNEIVAYSEIDSLFAIAGELERYLDQFIQIPGISEPKPFVDIFCHVYDFKTRYTDEPYIYWGLIDSTNIIDEDLFIKFNYQQVILAAKIEESVHKKQYWTQKYLKGKFIMFAGKAQKVVDETAIWEDSVPLGYEEWHIAINSPMQAAIINSDVVETLTLQDGRSWRELEDPNILALYDRSRNSRRTEFPLVS